jgi:hypothetical protein
LTRDFEGTHTRANLPSRSGLISPAIAFVRRACLLACRGKAAITLRPQLPPAANRKACQVTPLSVGTEGKSGESYLFFTPILSKR